LEAGEEGGMEAGVEGGDADGMEDVGEEGEGEETEGLGLWDATTLQVEEGVGVKLSGTHAVSTTDVIGIDL
jgi:hypothetical protein